MVPWKRETVRTKPEIDGTASREWDAFLDAKLTELTVGLNRNRDAMLWLQDRATDDGSLLAMVGTALAAIRQQERSLAEIHQRVHERRCSTLMNRVS